MQQTHEENVAQTYQGLRLAMVLLVLLLFVSVAFQIFIATGARCLQPSLSAYYYTPARPVFIAALCGIGACLIIYRGSTDIENRLLDFSGFLAFVVAFVPTKIRDGACDASNVPSIDEISASVRNNVLALLLVSLVAVLTSRGMSKKGAGRTLSTPTKWSLAASLTALVAGGLFYVLAPETFGRVSHAIAACALFAGIVLVIVENAWDAHNKSADAATRGYRNSYATVATGMFVVGGGLALAGWLIPTFDHWVFWLETSLIAGFAVFWIIQTRELGGSVTRRSSPSDLVEQT